MTKGDVVVIGVAVALILAIWGAIYLVPRDSSQLSVVVRVDGQVVFAAPVTSPEIQTKPIKVEGGTAYIDYGQNKTRVSPESDGICPDDICWKTGWISRAGQSVACVPNHMVVTLVGSGGVDAVVR